MKLIPLSLMTLYADLNQRLLMRDVRPGSISTKTDKGKKYLYAVEKNGQARAQRYLGPAGDTLAQAAADKVRRAQAEAKELRSIVSSLKNARIPAPTITQGRILEVVSNAGLFDRGVTLVGTVAYQTYACAIGAYLDAASYVTNDVDLSVAEFVAGDEALDIGAILRQADPQFEPCWHAADKLPRIFRTPSFQVDIVTKFGRGRTSPLPVEGLRCAAAALTFQEYLTEETMEVAALYGAGVLVRVPLPIRFAIHKLLVAQERGVTELAKRQKDLRQASELIDILIETDEATVLDTLDATRQRGKRWRSGINASLEELGRETRQGELPLPVTRTLASSSKRRAAARSRK
jgi:hypothetical protein